MCTWKHFTQVDNNFEPYGFRPSIARVSAPKREVENSAELQPMIRKSKKLTTSWLLIYLHESYNNLSHWFCTFTAKWTTQFGQDKNQAYKNASCKANIMGNAILQSIVICVFLSIWGTHRWCKGCANFITMSQISS